MRLRPDPAGELTALPSLPLRERKGEREVREGKGKGGEREEGRGREGKGRGGEVDSDAQLEQGRQLAKASPGKTEPLA